MWRAAGGGGAAATGSAGGGGVVVVVPFLVVSIYLSFDPSIDDICAFYIDIKCMHHDFIGLP